MVNGPPNGPPSPTRGASLQERLERSRRHKKWLMDQEPHYEEDRLAMSEAEQRQPGSRIQQIVQANQDRKKKTHAVPHSTSTAVPSPSSHLECNRGSGSSLGNHRVVAMPDNHHTRNGGRSLTSSYHSRSGATSPLPSGQKYMKEGKGEKSSPREEASAQVATPTTSSTAKATSLPHSASTPSPVSATFLHWQQREKRDLAVKKTPSSTPRHQQYQRRQPASPVSSFAHQFSQQYVVKSDSKKQESKLEASNEEEDDDQISYSSHSLSSVSRVSSSTHSSTARSWVGVRTSAGQNVRSSHPDNQFTKQHQRANSASRPYQQRSMPYNLKKKQTNSSLLQQGVPTINSDGTTNFKQLLKPVHDRDAKDDGSHQQMAYGAVIETPKKASVSNLHAMFNSQGSSEPIMPMNSKDARIRTSLPVALSLPRLQGQQRQDQKNIRLSSGNARCSTGNTPANPSWMGRRLSDKNESDQPATNHMNAGDLDERVATAVPTNITNTTINETSLNRCEEKDDVVANHSNQCNKDSLPSPSQHYVEASTSEPVVASWRERAYETQETKNKETKNKETQETKNKETKEGEIFDSYNQPLVDDEPQSNVPVQRSSMSAKPWEVDTKNSVVQSWEARKSKDRCSTTSSENDDKSFVVSPTSSIQSNNVDENVPIHNSTVPRDDVGIEPSGQDELLTAEGDSAQKSSLEKDDKSLQKEAISSTVEDYIGEKKSDDFSADPDGDLDKILDDSILDHLALAKSGGSNGSESNYDGVEDDLLLGSSHSGKIASDSFRETTHGRSRIDLEQSGSEELSLYTTDERTVSVSGFGSSVFDPFQNSQDSDFVLEKVAVSNGEQVSNVSTPVTPLGISHARCPRLIPSPKDCGKYRSTYFGDEATTPRAGSTRETKTDTKKAALFQAIKSDVATKQDFGPPIVVPPTPSQEKQEQLSFDDTDLWLNKDPDFRSTDDENAFPSSAGKEGISEIPTRSTSGPGKEGASVGEDLHKSSKSRGVAAETRQDVFDPFEDVNESPCGFFSQKQDSFNPFGGMDWPVKQASDLVADDVEDPPSDKNLMEI